MKNNHIGYRKDKKEILLKCLEKIEDSVSLPSSGRPTLGLDIYYYFIMEIFLENILFNKKLSDRTRRKILHSSIFRWIKYKKVNKPNQKLRLFIIAVRKEYLTAEKNLKKYSVLMFINIDRNSILDFWQISLLEESMNIISWNDISKIGIENLWEVINIQNKNCSILVNDIKDKKPQPNKFKFTPILFEISTFDPDIALEIASEMFDLFRAMINFSLLSYSYTYFRSEPQALSKILPSPVYVILDQNKINNIYHNVENYKYKKETVPEEKKELISFLISKFETTPQEMSTWNFLKHILLLYQNSLDVISPEFTFLSMWQVLENCLSLNENSLNNQQVLTRVKHLINCDPFVTEILNIIVDTRNKYVHKGSFLEEGDSLLFNLKLITDTVINQMIKQAEIYPSLLEIKEYFSLNTLGNHALERKKLVIESVLNSRKKSSN